MTNDITTHDLLIAQAVSDRAILTELAEQADLEMFHGNVAIGQGAYSSSARKAHDAAVAFKVLYTLAQVQGVEERHPEALMNSAEGDIDRIAEYFDELAESLGVED